MNKNKKERIETKKMETVQRACNKCRELNRFDNKTVKRKDVYGEDNTYYRVIYFKCQNCKEINVVQIDNIETLNVWHDLKDLMLKTMKKRLEHQTVSPKAVKKKDKLNKRLNKMRQKLKETAGIDLYVDKNTKEIFVKGLTISMECDKIDSNL